MKHYVVTVDGYQSIIAADSPEQAWQIAIKENGVHWTNHVREATEQDLDWQRAMNGRVPELSD